MKCPHCSVSIHFQESSGTSTYSIKNNSSIFVEGEIGFDVVIGICPNCNEPIILMRYGNIQEYESYMEEDVEDIPSCRLSTIDKYDILYPKSGSRPVDKNVPDNYANDFKEAVSVLNLSPKASAAISRRLLQHILREELKIKSSNLSNEIKEFITNSDAPLSLRNEIDAVRKIGNFAAHPIKSTQSGEIIEVEPGEAEWNLEVLESLFDFLFVQPKRVAERKAKLNEKLKEAGKKEI